MLWIGADHPDLTKPLDDLALHAHFFYRRAHFHNFTITFNLKKKKAPRPIALAVFFRQGP
jgi:hypothetical protein